MTRTTFTIAAIGILWHTAAATAPPVTFESPCECRDACVLFELTLDVQANMIHSNDAQPCHDD
jgi:hypothetical protein